MSRTAFAAAALAFAFRASAGPASPSAEEAVPPDEDFQRLPSPRPGDWRYVFREPVQTFAEYGKGADRAPPHGMRRVAVAPLRGQGGSGGLDEGTLAGLREFLGAYFVTRVDVEPARAVPASVRRRPSRGFGPQMLAEDVLRELVKGLTPGTLARLGVAGTDLYGSGPAGEYLNFVFGMGAYRWKVAVISPARYGLHYPDEPAGITAKRRVFKVAAHELGHVFGLAHCQTYRCCMNGSNSLEESDRRPVHLCPECLRKLAWHLGLDRAKRYRALERVYRDLGWEGETRFAARRAGLEPSAEGTGGRAAASGGGR